MNKRQSILLFLVLFLALIMPMMETEIEAAQLQQTQLRSYLGQGMEKTFNLETQKADAYMQQALELDRENPMGYAFLALSSLFSYEMSYQPGDREKSQESMLRYVSETLTRGEKRIANNAKDAEAYFAMSLAKIVKVRWAIIQKRYFIVAQETSNLWDYFDKVRKEDPQNYDVYFPMGLLHYHLDLLSGVTRFLSSVLITAGDRQKGIQELELAAKKGDLLKELAQAELAAVYSNYEGQPDRALPIAKKLKEAFPQNYNFSFVMANILSDLYRFDEAFTIAREIEKNILLRKPPYFPQLQSRYELLMGRIFFNQGEYGRAVESFQRALKDTASYNARVRAWAFVRLGMISDIRKDRQQAKDSYAKALEVQGGEGAAQGEARKYLATPYILKSKP